VRGELRDMQMMDGWKARKGHLFLKKEAHPIKGSVENAPEKKEVPMPRI
jgi:hypothetical protein